MGDGRKEIIGAQLYTVREHLRTPAEIEKSFGRISKAGYRAVQLSALGEIEPAPLAAALRANGLEAVSAHAGYARIVDQTGAAIEEFSRLGVGHVAVASLPAELRRADGYRRAAETLSAAGEALSTAGIRLAYHNHAFELEEEAGRSGLETIFEESDPAFLEMEIDTYWIAFAGADPAAWCRRCRGRMSAVHFKDLAVRENRKVMAEVGQGVLDWPAIISACREAGTSAFLVEQDHCEGDPFESLAVSRANLGRLLGGEAR